MKKIFVFILPLILTELVWASDITEVNIINKKFAYEQGEVVSYSYNDTCNSAKFKVADSKKRIVSNAYCYKTKGNTKINIDTSELPQGHYALAIVQNGKMTFSEYFKLEMVALHKKNGADLK